MYKQQALLKVTGIQYSPQAVEWRIQMHQFCNVTHEQVALTRTEI